MWKWNLETMPLNNERPLPLTRNFDKKLASCIPYFTALQVIKRRLISKVLNVCKKSIQLLQIYSLICLSRRVDQNVYKIADKSASILNLPNPSPFQAIGESYPNDHTRFKNDWNCHEVRSHLKSAPNSADNGRTSSGLSSYYRISNHKISIPKYLANTLTDFT